MTALAAPARPLLVAAAFALAFGTGGAGAAAAEPADDPAARCVADASEGQRVRDAGHLTAARAFFVSCAADSCPGIVRRECIPWLAEVDARMPTIVISTRGDDGKDLVGARVLLDGKPLAADGVGRSLELDPGPHRLEASLPGYAAASSSIVVAEREKGRAIPLLLSPNAAATAPRSTRATGRSIPVLSWVLGGVAVAGGAGFAVFWSSTVSDAHSLRSSCAPYCSQSRIDDVRGTATLAYVSLGVGIAAAAGAVLVYLMSDGNDRAGPAGRKTGRAAPFLVDF